MIFGKKDTIVVHWAFAGYSKESRDCTEAVPAKQAEPAISPAPRWAVINHGSGHATKWTLLPDGLKPGS